MNKCISSLIYFGYSKHVTAVVFLPEKELFLKTFLKYLLRQVDVFELKKCN